MYNLLWYALIKDKQFREKYEYGVRCNLIRPFCDELYNKMKGYTRVRATSGSNNLYEYICEGNHIGTCGITVGYLSYLFEESKEVYGYLSALIGSSQCSEGGHAWLVVNGIIYDTSLLLMIDENFGEILGYSKRSEYICDWGIFNIEKTRINREKSENTKKEI